MPAGSPPLEPSRLLETRKRVRYSVKQQTLYRLCSFEEPLSVALTVCSGGDERSFVSEREAYHFITVSSSMPVAVVVVSVDEMSRWDREHRRMLGSPQCERMHLCRMYRRHQSCLCLPQFQCQGLARFVTGELQHGNKYGQKQRSAAVFAVAPGHR